MKCFKIENGVIHECFVYDACQYALVIDGGYNRYDGGFWALLKVNEAKMFEVVIKDPNVYDAILQAYLSKKFIKLNLP